jgi:hypothetical protein
MMDRGNVGQIRKQEKMMLQMTELWKEFPMLTESLGQTFPPKQETMDANCGADNQPAPKVNELIPEEKVVFEKKEPIDITNLWESYCGLVCTCCIQGCTTQTVELENEHMVIKTKNNCDDSDVQLPYAQLGSVDEAKACFCCYSVNDISPGCGCSKALVESLSQDLQARKVKRGNIAQVKQLEKMQLESFILDTSAFEMVKAQGMDFPPPQQAMSQYWSQQSMPIDNVIRKKVTHFDASTKFEVKSFDISNYCEMCCSCLCCCGPTKTNMTLDEEEMHIKQENWCVTTNSRTPYAQLGSVDTEQVCFCCLEIPEVANPKCGCDKATVEEIAADMQARKVGRGNIAQLKMQENMITSAIKLDAKLDILMKKCNVAYPPDDDTMMKVFKEKIAVPGVAGATSTVSVQVPEGMTAGQTMRVKNPQGGEFDFQLPAGVSAGKTIQVQCPSQPMASVVGAPTPIR